MLIKKDMQEEDMKYHKQTCSSKPHTVHIDELNHGTLFMYHDESLHTSLNLSDLEWLSQEGMSTSNYV